MNIMVEVKGNYLRLAINDNIGPLLAALAQTQIYTSSGWGTDKKWAPCGTAEVPERPAVEFVDDAAFKEATPIIDSMAAEVKSANANWLEQYRRANELEKELKELKAKVATLTTGDGQEGAAA